METKSAFACGPAWRFSELAVQHGLRCERLAVEELSSALGAPLFPVRSAGVLDLGGCQIRVWPDASNKPDAHDSEVILEVKCPYTPAMRRNLANRLHFHGRQCLLQLLAFPNARCLIFAALD